jgi:fibronectin type 3 domain-containing protein
MFPATSKRRHRIPDRDTPSVPAGLDVTEVANGLRVSWTANAAAEYLKNYVLSSSATEGGTYDVIALPTGTFYVDDTITPGTSRWYKIAAIDRSLNQSAYSAAVQGSRVAEDTTPPSAPTGLTIDETGTSNDLAWDDDPGGEGLVGWYVERAPGDDNYLTIADVSAPAYSDSLAPVDIEHDYRVVAYDQADNISDPSNVVSGMIDGAALVAPVNVRSENRAGGVLVDWDDLVVVFDGYDIWYCDTGINGVYAKLNGSLLTTSVYLDETVPADTVRHYYIVADRAGVKGPQSAKTAGHMLEALTAEQDIEATRDFNVTTGTSPTYSNTTKDGKLGKQSANGRIWGGEFEGILAGQGADITNATMTFYERTNGSTSCIVALKCADQPSAAFPANAAEAIALPLTTALTSWTVPSFTDSANKPGHESPSLHTSVEEVLADSDWSVGDTLMVVAVDNGSAQNGSRTFQSAASSPKPTLHLEWTEVGNATPTTAITDLTAEATEAGIQLRWTAAVENDILRTEIRRGIVEGGAKVAISTVAQVPGDSYLDNTGLVPGTEYFYEAYRYDTGLLESAASNEASAIAITTDGGTPTGGAVRMRSNRKALFLEYPLTGIDATASMGEWILTTAGAASGATSLPCSALPIPLADNSRIMWHDPVSRKYIVSQLNGAHAAGATTLTVDALPAIVPATSYAPISGLQYRATSGDSVWKFGRQMVYADDGVTRAFYGNITGLTANTSYTCRLTVQNAGGLAAIEQAYSTQPNDITAAASLTPTHYVNFTTGNDTTGNGTIGTPWKTMSKAIDMFHAAASPAHWVVQGTGPWPVETKTITTSGNKTLVIKAQTLRVEYSGAATHARNLVLDTGGTYSTLKPNIQTGPSGSGATHENHWTAFTGTGPINNVALSGWYQCADPVAGGTKWMSYTSSLTGELRLVQPIQANAAFLTSALHIADYIQNCSTYHYGWFTFGSTLYLRLPTYCPSSNPNTGIFLWLAPAAGLDITATGTPDGGSTFRLCGYEYGGWQSPIKYNASDETVTDFCYSTSSLHGVSFYGQRSPFDGGANNVVQDCLLTNRHLRRFPDDPENGEVSWEGTKGATHLVTLLRTQQGGGGLNTIYTIDLTGTPTGTFRIERGNFTSADIAYNASAATIRTTLEAMGNIGAGNVTVTGGPLPALVTVELVGTLAGADITLDIPVSTHKINRIFAGIEGAGIFNNTGAEETEIERVVVEGFFNGTSTYNSDNASVIRGSAGKYTTGNFHVNASVFRHIADDATSEHEPLAINEIVTNCDIEYCCVGHSLAPGSYGPHIHLGNLYYMLSRLEVGLPRGTVSVGVYKIGNEHNPSPWVLNGQSTVYSSAESAKGFFRSNTGTPPVYDLINCLWRVTHQIARDIARRGAFHERFNILVAEDNGDTIASTGSGFRFAPNYPTSNSERLYRTIQDLIDYRAVTSLVRPLNGTWTNKFGAGRTDGSFVDSDTVDTMFTDAPNGDLTLTAPALARDAGGIILNWTPEVTGDASNIGWDVS